MQRPSSNRAAGYNHAWTLPEMGMYIGNTVPNKDALPWRASHAVIHSSVQDFVATLRNECCQEGSHFGWPSASIGFQVSLAIALHHLSPGQCVTLKNPKAPSPHILRDFNQPNVYYHGTSCAALQRGILRYGLQPVMGAGSETGIWAWGHPVPMVYCSAIMECTTRYPIESTLRTKNGGYAGEVVARDGTLPLRVCLKLLAPTSLRLWKKKDGTNDQHGFRPSEVYISHILFYALRPTEANVAQMSMDWIFLGPHGFPGSIAELRERYKRAEQGGYNVRSDQTLHAALRAHPYTLVRHPRSRSISS